MADDLLLDTGPFVALVDRSEGRHDQCVAVLEGWTGAVVTTEAVLTETLYLVGPQWRGQKATLEFILRGAFQLVPSSHASLQRVAALMERYRNVPMDFADATLVHVADREGLRTILTIDHSDFETYRIGRSAKFRILPAR